MSFFADLLGNAALAGGQMLEEDRNLRNKEDLMNRQAQMETERSIATEKRKLEMQEQQRQALQQRQADQMQQAETGGQAIGEARDMGMLQKLQSMGATGGTNTVTGLPFQGSPNASREELAAKLQDPATRAIYEQAGYIKPQTEDSVLKDQLTAASAGGLHDAASSLRTAYADTVKALQVQFKERMATRQEDRKEGEAKQTAARDENRHTAQMAAITSRENRAEKGDPQEKISTQLGVVNRTIADINDAIYKGTSTPGDTEELDAAKLARKRLIGLMNTPGANKEPAPTQAKPTPGAKPAPASSRASQFKVIR